MDEEFTRFVQAENTALMRTAWLLTGDRGLAEDLVQSALARAYAQWSKVQRADEPRAYVQRVLINTHLSWRRRLSSTERAVESVPEHGGGDHQAEFAARDEMRIALGRLSPRVRTAVVLRYSLDLTEAETARLMGCSAKTVNNHVTRGLAALRGLLTDTPTDDLAPASRRRP